MTKPAFLPGDRVTHILRPEFEGMVTCSTIGFNGWTYRVTWADPQIDDETHFAPELVPLPPRLEAGFR